MRLTMRVLMITFPMFVIVFMSSCNDKEIDTYQWMQELQISNYGISNPFVEYDGFVIYCTNSAVKCFDYNGKYMAIAGIPYGRLYDNGEILYCSSDEKLYAIDRENGTFSLVFNIEEINPELRGIHDFFVIGDSAYVVIGIEVYKINLTTKEIEMALNDVSSIAHINDKIYYSEHAERTFSIYEFDTHSGTITLRRGKGETFFEDTPAKDMYDSVITVDGNLYYSTRFPTAIFRYNPDGEDYLIDDFSVESLPENKLTMLYLYSGRESLYAAYVDGEEVIFKKYDLENASSSVLGQVPYFSVYRSYAIYHDMLVYHSRSGDEGNLFHLFN